MVIKITRFLTDAFNKQAKISHWNGKIEVGTPEKIKIDIKNKIKEQFGELFLEDANYVIFCKVVADEKFDTIPKKFAELLEAVLDTDIDKAEIKVLDLDAQHEDVAEDEENEETSEETSISSNKLLIVKMTSK